MVNKVSSDSDELYGFIVHELANSLELRVARQLYSDNVSEATAWKMLYSGKFLLIEEPFRIKVLNALRDLYIKSKLV